MIILCILTCGNAIILSLQANAYLIEYIESEAPEYR